jgi:hypothetical protein
MLRPRIEADASVWETAAGSLRIELPFPSDLRRMSRTSAITRERRRGVARGEPREGNHRAAFPVTSHQIRTRFPGGRYSGSSGFTSKAAYQAAGQPTISVDTKKKELVGQYANRGAEWRPEGQPQDVQVHDFPDKQNGKAVPYGVYDLTTNEGFVNVGTSHDTGAFAVNSIRTWWVTMGKRTYPNATELLVADHFVPRRGDELRRSQTSADAGAGPA